MTFDGRLIVIPPARILESPSGAAVCAVVAANGATALQIRLKNRPAGEVLAVTQRIMAAVDIPVYVNDRADVTRIAGAAGVHVGAEDLPAATIRDILPPPFRVGVSVGSPEEATRAQRAGAEYWSCGPFYATGSKHDAGQPLGPEGFRSLAHLCPAGVHRIAIGGIDARGLDVVVAAGAAGVAVISAVFESADIGRATFTLRRRLDELLG